MSKNRLVLFFVSLIFAMLAAIPSAHSFEFNGFGDVTYTQSTQEDNDQGAFALGAVDLYLSKNLDDRTDVFVELVIESTDDGEFVVDLERLQLGYLVNDALKLRAGRFHNLLGFWNTEYHHGAQLQTTVGRPAFLEFEDDGGIVPMHVVGLWASGRYKTAVADLTYGLMAGNGTKVQDGALDPNNIADNSGNKAVSLRLKAESEAISGLALGLSGSFAQVKGYTGDVETLSVGQRILAVDATYFSGPIEFIAEYYLFSNKDRLADDEKYSSSAYYIQAGYSITERLTPYARYEKISLDNDSDPYFTALGTAEYDALSAGVRFDLNLSNALKAEARFVDTEAGDSHEEYAVQWAVSF